MQLAVTAVHGVGGAPRDSDTGSHVLREELKAQFGLGLESQRGGDAHLRADLLVGQVFGHARVLARRGPQTGWRYESMFPSAGREASGSNSAGVAT